MRQSVIGQDEGIKTVATALSSHLTRLMWNQVYTAPGGPHIRKDNLLICGPTGCGKTESIRTVIRDLNLPIPVIEVSANTISNTGYKGKSLEDVLYSLMHESSRIL